MKLKMMIVMLKMGAMRMTMTMMRTWWLFLMILTRKMVLVRNLQTGQN
uniref:Uncharacterized protein n=1 Tax=Salix viminalis TaxID=40686 RepID=A0A6N2LIZ7_SALVM